METKTSQYDGVPTNNMAARICHVQCRLPSPAEHVQTDPKIGLAKVRAHFGPTRSRTSCRHTSTFKATTRKSTVHAEDRKKNRSADPSIHGRRETQNREANPFL